MRYSQTKFKIYLPEEENTHYNHIIHNFFCTIVQMNFVILSRLVELTELPF